jgi:hypothetical protein
MSLSAGYSVFIFRAEDSVHPQEKGGMFLSAGHSVFIFRDEDRVLPQEKGGIFLSEDILNSYSGMKTVSSLKKRDECSSRRTF